MAMSVRLSCPERSELIMVAASGPSLTYTLWMPMRSRNTSVVTVPIVRQGRFGQWRVVDVGPVGLSRESPGAPTRAATASNGSAEPIADPGDEKNAPHRANQAPKDSDVHKDHRRQIVAKVPATLRVVTTRS